MLNSDIVNRLNLTSYDACNLLSTCNTLYSFRHLVWYTSNVSAHRVSTLPYFERFTNLNIYQTHAVHKNITTLCSGIRAKDAVNLDLHSLEKLTKLSINSSALRRIKVLPPGLKELKITDSLPKQCILDIRFSRHKSVSKSTTITHLTIDVRHILDTPSSVTHLCIYIPDACPTIFWSLEYARCMNINTLVDVVRGMMSDLQKLVSIQVHITPDVGDKELERIVYCLSQHNQLEEIIVNDERFTKDV